MLHEGQGNEVIGKMRVVDLLCSMPGVGKVRARQLMERIGIAESRRVRGLGHQAGRRARARVRPRRVSLTAAHLRSTRLTVLAGPTAVGKGSVSADIRAHHPEIWISVSATTRAASAR